MASITSKLQKGNGWGPLAVHGQDVEIYAVRRTVADWWKVYLNADEKGRVRQFALGMERDDLVKLRDMITAALEAK